jgi:hypothetical protein
MSIDLSARVHHKRLTFDKFKSLSYRELALSRASDRWRRRSQRAVPENTDLAEKMPAQKVESLPM